MNFANMTSAHFIFIPVVLFVGIVIGWILGSRAAQDAFAMEMNKRKKEEGRGNEIRSDTLIFIPFPCLSLFLTYVRLPSHPQPIRQRRRQSCIQNFLLCDLNRIRHAVQRDCPSVHVRYRVSGARIAVARLSHRPGIDEVLRTGFERRLELGVPLGRGDLEPPLRVHLSAERDVGVAEEAERASRDGDGPRHVEVGDDVQVFVERRAVTDLDVGRRRSAGPIGRARRYSRVAGVSASRVHFAAALAMGLKSSASSSPAATLSWLPRTDATGFSARTRSTTAFGSAP